MLFKKYFKKDFVDVTLVVEPPNLKSVTFFVVGLRCETEGFGLEPISWRSGDNLARTHVKLTGTIGKRWTIVIDVAKETVTGVALDLGPLPLDSPVVDGFEEGAKLVLLLELELGGVRDGEGDGALVAGFEVEVWRVGMSGVKIQVGSALRTAVHGGHGSVGGNVNCEASFSAVRGITK